MLVKLRTVTGLLTHLENLEYLGNASKEKSWKIDKVMGTVISFLQLN